MVIFEFAGGSAWRYCAVCGWSRRLGARLGPAVIGSPRPPNNQQSEHDREGRPGKVRRRQLADEILRRLEGVAVLGDILAGLQCHSIEVRAVGARPCRAHRQHGRTRVGLPTTVAISRSGVSIGGLVAITTILRSMPCSRASAMTCRSSGTSFASRRRHTDSVIAHVGKHLIHIDVGRDIRRQERDNVRAGHTENRTRNVRRNWRHAPSRTRLARRACFIGQAYC